MNFWELILSPEHEENLEMKGLASAFDDNELQKIMEIITEYTNKNKDLTLPFMARVTDKIAPDYR